MNDIYIGIGLGGMIGGLVGIGAVIGYLLAIRDMNRILEQKERKGKIIL